jgi:hypothetical protein
MFAVGRTWETSLRFHEQLAGSNHAPVCRYLIIMRYACLVCRRKSVIPAQGSMATRASSRSCRLAILCFALLPRRVHRKQVEGTEYTQVFHATPLAGTYNMSPMIGP